MLLRFMSRDNHQATMNRLRTIRVFFIPTLLAILLASYVGSYLVLSRRGYAEADEYHMIGFYYFLPENSDEWRSKERAFELFYWPLNEIDQAIGTGRPLGAEPLWGLE